MDDLRVTRKNAIIAHCHQCMGYYLDGKIDCENVSCPLYSYMPYKNGTPDLEWTLVHPKMKGQQLLASLDYSDRTAEHLKKKDEQ